MRIWSSAILGIVVFCLMLLIGWFFGTDTDAAEEDHPRLLLNWITALLIGAAVGAINFALPYFYPGSNLAFIAPICLVVMIGIIAYLIYLWRLEGSSFRELVPMVVLTVLLFLTTKAAAIMTAWPVGIRFFYTLILVIPELCLVCAIGYYLSNLFDFRFREITHRQLDRALARITRVIAVLLATILLCTRVYWGGIPDLVGSAFSAFRMPDYSQEMEVDEDFVDGAVAEVTDLNRESWYGFYNLMLQTDVDPRNDFNFGPNPYEEGATAKYFDEVIRYRGVNDPALGSVMCGWTDANAGTRYEGEFFESCEEDWAKTLNLTKERFMDDQSLYYQTMNALFDFYDTADVSLEYRPFGLDDQMYMNPHTIDGVPDIIVMTTTDHAGYFLTYTFHNIKESTVKVSYRIDCGFQPTNVREVMNITPDDTPRSNPQPQSEPEKKEDPKPQDTKDPKPQNDPQPEIPGNGDTPPSNPPSDNPPSDNPPSQPVKVPSQSPKTNMESNDDPGPAPSTNNGVGAQNSTADTPSSAGTNHFDTVPEANAGTQQNKEVNQNQKTGSDDNTPTVSAPAPAPAPASDPAPAPAPAPVAVDNNGDSGGANDSTTPPPVAISTDTGQAIDDGSGGDSWGGPPD